MALHWSLSDSKYPHVLKAFLWILADLNKAVVWRVSIRPLIYNSYCSLPNLREPFQVYQLQLVSQSLSCSTGFLVLW